MCFILLIETRRRKKKPEVILRKIKHAYSFSQAARKPAFDVWMKWSSVSLVSWLNDIIKADEIRNMCATAV